MDWSTGLGDGVCFIYRNAMTADLGAPAAVYLGTSHGLLLQRFEDDERWSTIAESLPSVRAVRPYLI